MPSQPKYQKKVLHLMQSLFLMPGKKKEIFYLFSKNITIEQWCT